MLSKGGSFPFPSRLMSRQSRIHGAAAGNRRFVRTDRSAEKVSRPQPGVTSTRVLVDDAVGFRKTIVRAPTPGAIPFDSSTRYVKPSFSMYMLGTSTTVPNSVSCDSFAQVVVVV